MKRPRPKPEKISVQTAAALIDVSETTLMRWIRTGKLRATRYGRLWRIRISDLNQGLPRSGPK